MEPSGNLDKFPDDWTDPLELYGEHLQSLVSFGCNIETERNTLSELIEKHGARWVWCNRYRLVAVAQTLKDYPKR